MLAESRCGAGSVRAGALTAKPTARTKTGLGEFERAEAAPPLDRVDPARGVTLDASRSADIDMRATAMIICSEETRAESVFFFFIWRIC